MIEFVRPPRELYVRVTVFAHVGRWTFEPAVEFYGGDDYEDISHALTHIAYSSEDRANDTPMDRAEFICNQIADRWPGRGYFCETWKEGTAGFAQVVQPVGFPKNT